MGVKFSLLRTFEFVNDVHIAIGSGVVGIIIFVYNGMNTETFRTLCVGGLTAGCLAYACSTSEKFSASQEKAVFITGCDSGLGFSFAQHACEMGFTVFAGCLNLKSEGAKELEQICFRKKLILVELDVTKNDSIKKAVSTVENFLATNEPCELWALVNNAGVMVFGEFEWLTDRLINHQLEVNLFGTMKFTKAFLPLLRKYSGRIITISSHCANACLPGLAVYGATKSALSAWSDGLRVELNKYGVSVIKFVPGSFVQQSNIMSKQNENVFEMQSAMTQEQHKFYGDYFKEYNSYLSALSGSRKPKKIDDAQLYEVFDQTLLDKYPSATYVYENLKYKLFHTLFKCTPTKIRDALVVYFIQMPKWEREKQIKNISDVIA